MNKSKQYLTATYLEYYDKFINKFGKDRTLVLMHVGIFYEAYATLDKGPNLDILEELTEASVANPKEISMSTPRMWGFPIVAKEKFFAMLIKNGYHLIIVDQVSPAPKPKREVTAILSPVTYLESEYKPTSNFVADIVIEEIPQQNGQALACIGMSAIDVSTGEVYIHESYSYTNDEKLGLDETIRFINGLNPKETIINKEKLIKLDEKYIIEYLDLKDKLFQFKEFNIEHSKISFQKKTLEMIFSDSKNVSNIFDTLCLGRCIYARKSLITLLIYISDHYTDLVKNIYEPIFYMSETNLVLGNDAINQLNIVNNTDINCNRYDNIGNKNINKMDNIKYQCLLDVINKASTGMGKRYVKMRLVSPYTNVDVLNQIYDIVDIFIKEDFYIQVDNYLKNISDIERLERKLSMAKLSPYQMVKLIKSYESILALFSLIKTNNCLANVIKTAPLRKSIKKLNDKFTTYIDINKAELYNLNDIKQNIFNVGMYPHIDDIQKKIGLGQNSMGELLDKLDAMINESKDNIKKSITLKHNKNYGYHFVITKLRYEKLKDIFETTGIEYIEINGNKIGLKSFQLKETKNTYKMLLPMLKDHTDDINELTETLVHEIFNKYIKFMNDIYAEYKFTLRDTIKIITKIDYYCTIAKVAKLYNYIKPIIEDQKNKNKSSFIFANNIRHPIVERIIDYEYISHNIDIGRDLKGMLIYGLNSSGKSVLMKAIGISVIMAQAGFFVPASKYVYYPYKSLYTRITGGDDLFRGLSSFTLEMVELNNILKRSDNTSLVIGDEVCRGTEHVSGSAIVASALIHLSKLNSSFVFATHLHEIMELEEIKNDKNINAFHLSVDINPNTYELIYDRNLKLGPGEKIYGIIVAKNIIRNNEFINKALEIKNILLDRDPNSSCMPIKKSRYNKDVLLDRCTICNKINTFKNPTSIETHHINHQKDCENGFCKRQDKSHISKNHASNLASICQSCHDDIHRGNINIEGNYMTSKGKQLIVKKIK